MIKENKDFFLYILGIILMIFITLFLLDFLVPGSVSDEKCGFLGFKCWFDDVFTEEKVYDKSPDMKIDTNKDYKAKIKTNYGDIEIDLYEQSAPHTVNNFVFLAEDGYYKDVKFHRVIRGFLIQSGDRNTLDSNPDNDGEGGPGYTIKDEINWDSLDFSKAKIQQLENLGYKSTDGVNSRHLLQRSIAMANLGPDSNGSQFFIVTASDDDIAVKGLEGRHTVFGEIISGWDVVLEIEQVQVDDPASNSPKPVEDIVISDVEIYTD